MGSNPIGRLTLTLLLLVSFILGAFLTYLWVAGYYIALELNTPPKAAIAVFNATFSPQEPTYFNLSILNPSFSPEDAKITEITILTEDGALHTVGYTVPIIPAGGYTLPVGRLQTFQCYWVWANHTGENLKIMAFTADGSGATFQAVLPLVRMEIGEMLIDPTRGDRFNITIQNSVDSITYVNITEMSIIIDDDVEEILNVEPPLPQSLENGSSINFTCLWNWTDYQGESVRISVNTLQGYTTQSIKTIATYVTLSVEALNFTDTRYLNVTVVNAMSSVIPVNITGITILLENGTIQQIAPLSPQIPYTLNSSSTVTFNCLWNWTAHLNEEITVTAYTSEGYRAELSYNITLEIEISEISLNPTLGDRFNVTIQNSASSVTYVDITGISIILDDVEEILNVEPPLPQALNPGSSINFTCLWNWTDHQGESVRINVDTLQGCAAQSAKTIPTYVTLTVEDVVLDVTDTGHLNITISNAESSVISVNITGITILLENGTILQIEMDPLSPQIPYRLESSSTVTFTCTWDWTEYRDKEITVTVYTYEGYKAKLTSKTPL